MKKKLFLIVPFLVIFGLVFNFSVSNAETMSVAELQALIEALQEQIAQLQHQLNEIQTQSEVWCHDFEVNLRYGDRGPEVSALQAALKKEGFTISEKEIEESYFGDWTAAAVVGFQEKYKEDVLAPWGLEHGTGFVGSTTRAKLNELYGCKGVSPVAKPVVSEPHEIPPTTKPSTPTTKSITLISPNGGERWEVGKTYTIRWEAPGYAPDTSVQIALRVAGVDPNLSSGEATIANTTNSGSYTWKIPAQLEDMVLGAGNVYKIVIYIAGGGPGKYDLSDEYFSIVSSEESCHTSPLWSWDYCSPECPCSEGEGDCDTDADCQAGLYCAQDIGAKYGQASSIDVCKKEKSITLISPNGGERWEVGKTYTIRWEASRYDPDTPVQIALRVAGVDPNLSSGEATIANTKNIGSYTWKIPAQLEDITLGGENMYKIVIYIRDGGLAKYDLSNEYFSIVPAPTTNTPKSITVISPNGGEKWMAGQTYEITWTSIGVDKVTICVNYGRGCLELGGIPTTGIDASLGKFSWRIDPNAPYIPGDNLKIRVTDVSDSTIYDESDDYFSIVSPETCHTSPLWSWDYCSPDCPCAEGEGDCDTDADCQAGLYCAQNVGAKYGQESSIDVCEKKEEKSIILLSPNGGERWEIGKSYDITWIREGEFEEIVVELARYPEKGLPEYKSLGTFDGRTALYRWTITSDVVPDDKYKIEVLGHTSDGRVISDESDGYFSIVEVKKGELSCSDTDGGKNYYEKGEVTVQGLGYQTTFIDSCQDSTLNEGYCENNDIQAIKYKCPHLCKDGRCVAPLVCNSYGDMDNDGYITKEDVDILFELVDKAVSEEQKKKGDVNGNGEIDFDDIVKLNSYLEGEIDTLPVCEE